MLTCLWVFPSGVFADTAKEALEKDINQVLEVLKDQSLDKAAKEDAIRKITDEIFDYTLLSKLTLSRNWKKFNDAQKKEFVTLFKDLLGSVYMGRLLEYTSEKIVYGKERELGKNRAEVKTEVVTSSKSIPIDYRMVTRNGEWRVYDLIIEGISLVQNYRKQFSNILKDKSPEDLLEILRKKGKESS
jgi:phospholipid transport system substrate-binding protein